MSERVLNLRDFRVGRRYVLPPDVVRIDRMTRWGNPFAIGQLHVLDMPSLVFCVARKCPERHTRESSIEHYRAWALQVGPSFLEPLRGKRLACWCAPLPCHGDVLAELIP